jgi:hypothetical protein
LTSRNSQSKNRDADITFTPGVTDSTTTTGSGSAQASQVAEQVKQSASDVTEQAKQTATSQIAVRKEQAAQGLSAVSSSMRQMGDNLRQNDQTSGYAQYVHQAAEQVDRFSGYLQQHDARDIMADAEDWARRNPALVLGGAFALGLLASRFLKSGMGGQNRAARTWRSGPSGQYRSTNRPYWNDPYYDRYNDRYNDRSR